MILCKEYDFEIQENKDSKVLKGTFRDLNSGELKEMNKKNKAYEEMVNKGVEAEKKLQRISKLLTVAEKREDWEEVEELLKEQYLLEDELENLKNKAKPEDKEIEMLKWKFSVCLESEHKSDIIALAETYGYHKVQDIIFQDVIEK